MMTIGEFRAFLEGMAVGETPTAEQWARIKEKIDALQMLPAISPSALPSYPGTSATDPYLIRRWQTTCISPIATSIAALPQNGVN